MTDPLSPQATAALLFAGIVLWFAASVVYRLRVGKPLLARPGRTAVFSERWASCRVGTGLLARLSTARNCVHVQVDAGALRIHPHFPLTLGFLPELYDMDQVIPLQRITAAQIIGGHWTKAVELKFLPPNGKEQTVQLLLKRAEQFIACVHPARKTT